MRRTSILLLSSTLSVSLTFGQTPIGSQQLKGYTTVIPLHSVHNAAIQPVTHAPAVSPIPMWNYSVVGYDGNTYTGMSLGRAPSSLIKTTTTIPLQIVPLIVTIDNSNSDNGNLTYDSTVTDPCVTPGSFSDLEVIQGSPLFQSNSWTMNGVNVGNTQYEDAFQRAEYWSQVKGSNYHLLFNPTVLSPQTLTFGSNGTTAGPGTNYSGIGCGGTINEGVVNVNDLDTAIQGLINGPLSGTVNVGTFPIFVLRNVVAAETGVSLFSSCCVLGYHGAFTSGSNIQVYSPFTVDSNGLFGSGYTSDLAHELGEAINDPTGNNLTPPWGAEGQVPAGMCQNNFEVGDPLSPNGGVTPTNPFMVTEGNGLTYTVQELAFFNWFFGGTNLGAGGAYSDNGTFGGHAIACPPGGSNTPPPA